MERGLGGWSDFTVGMTLSQNHRVGGPGGSEYPLVVERRFLPLTMAIAKVTTMVPAARMAVTRGASTDMSTVHFESWELAVMALAGF